MRESSGARRSCRMRAADRQQVSAGARAGYDMCTGAEGPPIRERCTETRVPVTDASRRRRH